MKMVEIMEILVPDFIGARGNLLRRLIGFSHHDKQPQAGSTDRRIGAMKLTPNRFVMVEFASDRRGCVQTDDIDALLSSEFNILLRVHTHPHGRMGFLDRFQNHGDIIHTSPFAFVRERSPSKSLAQDLKGLNERLLRRLVIGILTKTPAFEGRNSTPDAKLKTSSAQLIKHAYLLGEAQRMI